MTAAPVHQSAARRHRRSVWLGAALTVGFVAAGAAIAHWTLPAVSTPDNVVRAFFAADDAHDWATTWAMTCQKTRSEIGGYTAYIDGLAYLDNYDNEYPDSYSGPDVNLEIDGVRVFKGPSGPSATVSFTWSYDEENVHQESSGEVLVVKEGGETRVCDKGSWLW